VWATLFPVLGGFLFSYFSHCFKFYVRRLEEYALVCVGFGLVSGFPLLSKLVQAFPPPYFGCESNSHAPLRIDEGATCSS
jgi:hypothetical protein